MTDRQTRLSSLTPGAPSRLRSYGFGYTLFVRAARLLLPVAALVIIGIVIARLNTDPKQQDIAQLPKDNKTTSAGNIELEQATYEGTDASGQAYSLTSEAISRNPDQPDMVYLTRPKAEIALSSGGTAQLLADKGAFDTKTAIMTLEGSVGAYHDDGYELHMDQITADIRARAASTDGAVTGQGPLGTLSAAGLRIEDGGDRVIFKGPVKMTLHNL